MFFVSTNQIDLYLHVTVARFALYTICSGVCSVNETLTSQFAICAGNVPVFDNVCSGAHQTE